MVFADHYVCDFPREARKQRIHHDKVPLMRPEAELLIVGAAVALGAPQHARLSQLAQQPLDWAEIVRAVALDLSALIVEHQLDFDIDTQPAPVRAHEWALRELSRNLIHNAIKHGVDGGRLTIRLVADRHHAALTVFNSGSGISVEQRTRLFQPFAAGSPRSGSGLGLAICHEIVTSLGGQIELDNRVEHGAVLRAHSLPQ